MIDAPSKPSNINWPNTLTVLRIFLACLIPPLITSNKLHWQLLGCLVFFLASLTDYYDGVLARRYSLITTFGQIADPIADKLLTLGTFATIAWLGVFPFWILILILIREIGITLLRFYFLYKGQAVAAVKSGKQKTALQIAAISFSYFHYLFQTHLAATASGGLAAVGIGLQALMWITLLLALYQTVYSGIDFLRNNWHLIVVKDT